MLDDEHFVLSFQLVMRKILAKGGFSLTSVENGQLAVEAWNAERASSPCHIHVGPSCRFLLLCRQPVAALSFPRESLLETLLLVVDALIGLGSRLTRRRSDRVQLRDTTSSCWCAKGSQYSLVTTFRLPWCPDY